MSRGVQVRETIELLCRILTDNGASKVEAETLRKAKFDKHEAVEPLWLLLFELTSYCKNGKKTASAVSAFNRMKTEGKVVCVKKEMQRRGYLSRAFASLPSDMHSGSRELLLAFSWLLHTEAIIQKFMENRSSPVDDDIVSLYESVSEDDGGDNPAFTDQKYSPAQRVQQLLMLNHKLRMNLRLLHASEQEYAILTHKIHNATYGVSLTAGMNHLTTMQTHMLRHPQDMKKVLSLLEADSCRLENLLLWEDRELVFWEWMESVLDLKVHGVDNKDTDSADSGACASRTVFLDVPSSMGADIASSRRNLMSMILQFESAIERLEDLWETKRSTVSEWELDHLLTAINAEISQLQLSIRRGVDDDRKPAFRGPCLNYVKNKPERRAPAKVSNAMAASNDRGNSEPDTRTMQEEISRLQMEAGSLEQELMSLRRDCLQRLNTVAATVPDAICIIPPHLRKLCQ